VRVEALMTSKPNNTFHRDASNRLTYDIYKVESDRYPELCRELATEFDLKPASELAIGLDEIFQDYSDGEHTVGLDWDIWSGLIVVAKDPQSEQLVRQIAVTVHGQKTDLGGSAGVGLGYRHHGETTCQPLPWMH
jgi:hypothetical protein